MWTDLLPLLGLVLRFLAYCAVIVAVFLAERLLAGTEVVGFVVLVALGGHLVHVAGRDIRL